MRFIEAARREPFCLKALDQHSSRRNKVNYENLGQNVANTEVQEKEGRLAYF